MKVGLTYDLRSEYLAAGYSQEETAEFDRAETIEALEGALRELGHESDRIGHARQLIERLAAGDRWELVLNICEGLHGLAPVCAELRRWHEAVTATPTRTFTIAFMDMPSEVAFTAASRATGWRALRAEGCADWSQCRNCPSEVRPPSGGRGIARGYPTSISSTQLPMLRRCP